MDRETEMLELIRQLTVTVAEQQNSLNLLRQLLKQTREELKQDINSHVANYHSDEC